MGFVMLQKRRYANTLARPLQNKKRKKQPLKENEEVNRWLQKIEISFLLS